MKTYSVYEHVFPNGKRYIGISCEPEKRWNGGHGYDVQPKMKRAIQCYGWDNIEHNIICEGLPKEQAERLEMYLIDKLDTIDNGYNVSIGGGKVKGYYLSEHVLEMLRVGSKCDAIPEDLERLYQQGKKEKRVAEILNLVDMSIEKDFTETILGVEERAEAYFYYATHIIHMLIAGDYDRGMVKPYRQARYDLLFKKVNVYSKEYGRESCPQAP